MWHLAILLHIIGFDKIDASTCYTEETSSAGREVIGYIPQVTLVGCHILCNAEAKCQATLLNLAGTGCILLGPVIVSDRSCEIPYRCYVKTAVGCTDIAQGPMAAAYEPGECLRQSDMVGDLATNGTWRPCGRPSSAEQRLVIDVILHNGEHRGVVNSDSTYAVWDAEVGSWYIKYFGKNERFYFWSAKCVSAPNSPLTQKCECAPLPEATPADRYKKTSIRLFEDYGQMCTASTYLQMYYSRSLTPDAAMSWKSADGVVTCTIGFWNAVSKAGPSFSTFEISRSVCVDDDPNGTG